MSVTVSCTGCAKSLTVKDEFVGKRLKCPQCGATFTATAAQARSPGKQTKDSPKLTISPGVIVLVSIVVLVIGSIVFWKLGPGKTLAQWGTLQPKAEEDVKDVIDRAMQSSSASDFAIGGSIAHAQPHSLDLTFFISPMPISMPDKIGFAGTTTQGAMTGRYYPATGEIEADVEVGGLSFPGAGVQRHGSHSIKVTGRNKDGNVTAEVDGKPTTTDWGDGVRKHKL